MKATIDYVDYEFNKSESNDLVVSSEGEYCGKVTSLPEFNKKELRQVFEVYIDMYTCLLYKDVSYTDLMKLYERYINCETELINDTLIIRYKTEIVAVLVGINDLDLVDMDMRAKLIFYYFTINEFNPYCIDYTNLLGYSNDLNF